MTNLLSLGTRRLILLGIVFILALAVPLIAFADNVVNDVTGSAATNTFTAGGSLTVAYRINATGNDGQQSCNASDGSPATVTINVPASVTATPSTLLFTECGVANSQNVVFSASIAGDYAIPVVTVGDSGVGSYNVGDTDFTLHVLPAPPPTDSTPPVITPNVSGTLGSNGWYTSNVTVSWSVTEAQSAITSTTGCGPTTISVDTAGTTFTCSATSAGGTNSVSVTIKRDATAPTISGSASPAANLVGWNNTDVNVSFNCSDAMSGVASCGPAQTLSGEGAGQSISGTATDYAGNSASTSVSGINIDMTAPIASASALPAPNANGWNNTAVTVSFTGSDALSGGVICDPDVVLSGEGADQSASGTCTDLAGNISLPATASGINIDVTAPIASASALPAPNANGWNNTAVTVHFEGTDALSGGVICDPDVVLSGEGADQSASGTCTDLAGNISLPATASGINIDVTAPIASASALPAPNANGWNNTAVTVSFTGSDALSGGVICDPDVVLSGEGADQSASGTCTDLAGNVSLPATASGINIDMTAPVATALASPPANGFGWNNTDVIVSFTGIDALSGVFMCSVPVTLTAEGAGQSASGICADLAGNNSAPAVASGINIDKTAPTLVWTGPPADGDSFYFGFVPPAPTCVAADGLSGLNGSCLVTGYGTTVGSHTMTAAASDKAGNTTTETRTYTVMAWTLTGFYKPVDMSTSTSSIIWNSVKGGSTVPLKFEIFAGPTEITTIDAIDTFTMTTVTCSSGVSEDVVPISELATGGTSLRYDSTGGQFIFNWQTPKQAGKCYRIAMTAKDGSRIDLAYFKTK